MRFYQLRNWLLAHLTVSVRIRMLTFWYLISLMVETRKHSLHFAATLSGLTPPQLSKFLRHHAGGAAVTLEELSTQQARQLAPLLTNAKGLPWTIIMLIDATLQTRSGLQTENVQRFNHGYGYVIGHQWTNIVLVLNEVLIPLPPIPFYSKHYCRKLQIAYHTEHDRLVEYLTAFDLERYLGPYRPDKVVVLMDSGYDVKKVLSTIRGTHWHFLCALKCDRSVKSPVQDATTPRSTGWTGIAQFFKDHRRLAWATISVPTTKPKDSRMEFRVRQTSGSLKGVGQVQLVCSECKKRRHGRRKYLACSDLMASATQIVMGYRLRWLIEIFHKQIKQHLGFEEMAPTYFCSIETHVHLVYCAYILLHSDIPGLPSHARSMLDKQAYIKGLLEKRTSARVLQLLTQFGGVEKCKEELKAVLSDISSHNPFEYRMLHDY